MYIFNSKFHLNPLFLIPFLKDKRVLHFQKCLVVLAGPPLTGKSTLGKMLAKKSNFTLLDIDEVRQKLFPGDKRLSEDEERNIMRACYQKNHELAKEFLLQGDPVILVATYSRDYSRAVLKELTTSTNSPFKFFLFDAPEKEIKIRLNQRKKNKNLSNIKTYADFLSVKNRYQNIADINVKKIDTSEPRSKSLQQILENLDDLQV